MQAKKYKHTGSIYTYWLDACFRNSSSVCLKVSKRHLFTVFSTLTTSPVRQGKTASKIQLKCIWAIPVPPFIQHPLRQCISRTLRRAAVAHPVLTLPKICVVERMENFWHSPLPHGCIFMLKVALPKLATAHPAFCLAVPNWLLVPVYWKDSQPSLSGDSMVTQTHWE